MLQLPTFGPVDLVIHICDCLWENRAQRGMRRRRKKIDLVLKIVLNKPNEGNG